VNLLWLVPGVVGGSEEYTTRTLQGLAELDPPDLEITIFALRPFSHAHPEVTETFQTVTLPLTGREKSVRVAAESSWLGFMCRREGIELVHHAGGIMPAMRSTPGVLTIHDLQPLVMPEHFSPVKRNFSRIAVPRSIRAARLVLTPSEHARQSVIDLVAFPEDRVVVVPHGVDPVQGRATAAEEREVRDRYDLDRPFFLFPAITYPHKNHVLLVRALAAVPDALLVLTGGQGQMEDAIAEEAEDRGVRERIRRLGRIPRQDLDVLYGMATALTFPSTFEGFGAPVLEAMSRGCPVLAADTTALPEVVGTAGILLPPDDEEAWSDAMNRLLADDAVRSDLADSGRRRAADYNWLRSAEALVSAYDRALQEEPA
jgi:alpha-1,3-rhamnosyl/mannosyltransferase